MIEGLNALKRKLFYDMMELSGRVFIIVKFSEDVYIGKRGFLQEEKENGLMLVFNSQMKFTWEEDILSATLSMANVPTKCVIPANNIVVIYCPELQAQFVVNYNEEEKHGMHSARPLKGEVVEGVMDDADSVEIDNVVEVDFTNKKRQK